MNCDQTTEQVRQHVRSALSLHGASSEAPLMESFLIRNGCYCGRRFRIDGWSAVWFVEEQQIKLFDRCGRLTQVLNDDASVMSDAA